MDALGGLALDDDHPDAPALRTGGDPARAYDYRRFRTTARKTGNFFRHLGVRDGATVAVAERPAPEAIFALLGTALLDGTVRFGPPREVEARVLVAPADRLDDYRLPPGSQRVSYDGAPTDPAHHHFERGVWSENPGFPATPVDPASPAPAAGDGRALSHADVLAAAREVAGKFDPDDVVALRAATGEPGAVVAGVVAPLLAGACVLLPGEVGGDGATGTVAVVPDDDADAPESRRVVARDVV